VFGLVTFENLTAHAGIRVALLPANGVAINAISDNEGRFAFANLPAGAYILEASAHGFLAGRLEFTLTEGQQFELPAGLLKRGDTNEDNVIDLQDIMLIAANFNGPAAVSETDINGDGWVDIRDLSLLGALFGTIGPLPWGS
ncbi:MAG: carboxypeptidase regulatory-like domain-containing protein, partial [Anaerolineae bacterium]|nr:carboxypeptidase regulatory-like domain-containing protein [Anaerolineae bacterium]